MITSQISAWTIYKLIVFGALHESHRAEMGVLVVTQSTRCSAAQQCYTKFDLQPCNLDYLLD